LCNQQTDSEDTHSFDVIRCVFVSVVLTKRGEGAVEDGDDGGDDKTGVVVDHWKGSDF
jgi:hypothetical protein